MTHVDVAHHFYVVGIIGDTSDQNWVILNDDTDTKGRHNVTTP